MFFVLSKTVVLLALPSNLLILIGLAGAILMATRFARLGRRLAVASLLLLALIGFSPLGSLLETTLEDRFPPWDPSRGPADGIVVLGGAISPDRSAEVGEVVFTSSFERILTAVRLARRFPAARIVYTGGRGTLDQSGPGEADFVLPVFENFGIARERVLLEGRSRNTAENAVFTKALVAPKPGERWLLVTSAVHMPRAIGSFRRAGFPVEAYPTDWSPRERRHNWLPTKLLSRGLSRTDNIAHEWIGLTAYWLTGRTNSFLPGPDRRR